MAFTLIASDVLSLPRMPENLLTEALTAGSRRELEGLVSDCPRILVDHTSAIERIISFDPTAHDERLSVAFERIAQFVLSESRHGLALRVRLDTGVAYLTANRATYGVQSSFNFADALRLIYCALVATCPRGSAFDPMYIYHLSTDLANAFAIQADTSIE